MRIYENGIYRDMTAAEIVELEKLAAEAPAPEPTAEERIAALEQDNAEVKAALQAGYNDLNQGQRKKMRRNPAMRAMFERYGVEIDE